MASDAEIDAGIEDVEVELEQEQEDIEQENEADQYAVADAYAAYTGFGEAVEVVQSGTLEAAATGIEAEARSEADADLEQIADQGNENSQTATPTVAFTAAPTFGRCRRRLPCGRATAIASAIRRCCRCRSDDAEIDAGIEDVDVDVEQEQEDIDQSNDADQDGAAYATADNSGDVSVEQSGDLFAGTVVIDPVTLRAIAIGDGIDASSVADAEASLEQAAVQSNLNRQDITEDADPLKPAFGFTADATFTNVAMLRATTPRSKPGSRTSRSSSSRSRRTSIRRTRAGRLAWLTPNPMRMTSMWSRAASCLLLRTGSRLPRRQMPRPISINWLCRTTPMPKARPRASPSPRRQHLPMFPLVGGDKSKLESTTSRYRSIRIRRTSISRTRASRSARGMTTPRTGARRLRSPRPNLVRCR